jgi:hypothetical protein
MNYIGIVYSLFHLFCGCLSSLWMVDCKKVVSYTLVIYTHNPKHMVTVCLTVDCWAQWRTQKGHWQLRSQHSQYWLFKSCWIQILLISLLPMNLCRKDLLFWLKFLDRKSDYIIIGILSLGNRRINWVVLEGKKNICWNWRPVCDNFSTQYKIAQKKIESRNTHSFRMDSLAFFERCL